MKTCIDWLSFRTRSGPFEVLDAIRPLFGTTGDLLTLGDQRPGRDGWLHSHDIMLVDIRLGSVDNGGHHQREWVRVQLTGTGCEWVQDWSQVESMAEKLKEAEIRRLDIALTTFNREMTYAGVLLAHSEGEFKNRSCGANPNLRCIENSDPHVGNTAYIGSRTADKFLRCYEKGKEALKHLPDAQRRLITDYEGHHVDDVFRVELELKAKEQYLPWTTIGQRDSVFAGAYPFCAALLPGCPEWKLQKLPDFKPKAAITVAIENCRTSYGPTLRLALEYFGGDRDRLLSLILAEKPSDKLLEAGVMTV
jgi:DNA relaxase NicK